MDAEELLRSLGATGKLKGFFYAVYMVEQVQKDPMATSLITKCLYPEVAKHFGISPGAVERNLRTVIRACWNRSDREVLDKVAGTRLCRQPTNSEFLDMAAAYLRRQTQKQSQ